VKVLLLMIVILPLVAIVGTMFMSHQVVRRAPSPAPALPGIRCPFCGHEMRPGRIMHAGNPVWWEPNDAPRPRLWVSKPGTHPVRGAKVVFERTRLAVDVRGATVCDGCEAVVLDPKARSDRRSMR